MRMWNANPSFMCDVHLVSEHRELHMIAGAMRKNVRLEAHVARGLIEPYNLKSRHAELEAELLRRGFRHRSPLQPLPPLNLKAGYVCESVSWSELIRRCEWCRSRAGERPYVYLREPHECDSACAERTSRDQAARPRVERGIAPELP